MLAVSATSEYASYLDSIGSKAPTNRNAIVMKTVRAKPIERNASVEIKNVSRRNGNVTLMKIA